jgi:hypothetical protein
MSRLTGTILARRPWLAEPGIFSYGFTEPASHGAAEGPEEGIAIAERLIAAYRQAVAAAPAGPRPEDMWAQIGQLFQPELVALAEGCDAPGLASYLQRLPKMAAAHGFFQGEASFNALVASPGLRGERALWLMDHLVGMAEAAGVLDARCPEQGDYAAAPAVAGSRATATALRDAIEHELGVTVSMPPLFEGLFALEPVDRAVHLRGIMGAYVAWKALGFARDLRAVPPQDARVAEIGAGIGYSAYAACQLGAASYTVYDLPAVNIAQGYFLLRSLPPGTVSLYGEAGAAVRVMPAFAFHQAAAGAFDIVVNVDSMPEIARAEAQRYMGRLPAVSPLFFSINQEAQAPQVPGQGQLVVRRLAAASGLQCVLRYPNWVRAGYVDELWTRP